MKFIKVNMIDKTIQTAPVPDEYENLGGRGLTSLIINNEVPADCDPLGPENKLIIAPGYLSGTPLVNSSGKVGNRMIQPVFIVEQDGKT